MIELIHILIIAAWLFFAIGLHFKDSVLVCLSGMFITCLGIYMIVNGISQVSNWLVNSVGIIHIGFGVYILVRASYELITGKGGGE